MIGQCMHYKLAGKLARRLIGADEFARLNVDFLTDHITTFSLAALGVVPPLDVSGESSCREPIGSARGANGS